MIVLALTLTHIVTAVICYRISEWKTQDRLTGTPRTFMEAMSLRFLVGVFFGVALVICLQTGYLLAISMIHGRL